MISAQLTDRSGRVSIRKLAPGDYWITVSYLGVIAGEHCFHVLSRPSMAAKATLRYRWGDSGVSMRSVGGTLQEWQPGKGGLPIWNLAHGVNAPIRGATAVLQNAVTREVRRSESDAKGVFGFGPLPDGIHVLHVEGGATARSYEPADIIIPVSNTTGREALVLTLR